MATGAPTEYDTTDEDAIAAAVEDAWAEFEAEFGADDDGGGED